MNEKYSINKRINDIYKVYYKSKKQFAESVGISGTGIGKILNNETIPSVTIIAKLLEVQPDISAEWLMRGEGDMKKGELEIKPTSNNDNTERAITYLVNKIAELEEELKQNKI